MPIFKMRIFTLPVVGIFYGYPLSMGQLSSLQTRMHVHLHTLVFLFKTWITSMAIRALSRIYRPSTNADCFWETHLSGLSQRDIGRHRSFIEMGLSHLRMRRMFVSLRLMEKYPLSNQLDAATKISSQQCSQTVAEWGFFFGWTAKTVILRSSI
jgi:hypothetical protein